MSMWSQDEIQLFNDLQQAIFGEINWIRSDMHRKGIGEPLPVVSATLIDQSGDGFLYQFAVGTLYKKIPIDTSVSYSNEEHGIPFIFGQIEFCNKDEDILHIHFDEFIGDDLAGGRLIFDLTYLLEKLSQALTSIKDNPEDYNIDLIKKLLHNNGDVGRKKVKHRYDLNKFQLKALEKALGSDILYIWGPPGTGKTTALGVLTHEFVQRGKRVLLTSHTNVAVDTALNSVLACSIKFNQRHKLLRYGHFSTEINDKVPGVDEAVERIVQREHLDLRKAVLDLGSEVMEEKEMKHKKDMNTRMLLRYIMSKAHQSDISEDKITKGKKINAELQTIVYQAVEEAAVIGTTLTKLYSDSQLDAYLENIDVLIIDEVSCASVPQVINAAGKTDRSLILVGDFNQLPPIVQSDMPWVETQLGTNIFEYAKLDNAMQEYPKRPILQTQYRMHPDICTIVNQLFYWGKLNTAANKILKNIPISSRKQPMSPSDGAVFLIDTSGFDARNETKEETRMNIKHAQIISYIVGRIQADTTVGILTPYRGQRRIIKQVLENLEKSKENVANLDVAVNTIHSFQGQERDVIILDLCDAPPVPPHFLNEKKHRALPMLLNVALSRAKKRLMIIAHADTFRKHLPGGLVTKMLGIADRWGQAIKLTDLDQLDLIFASIGSEWPATKRMYELSTVREMAKDYLFVQWRGEIYPIDKVEGHRVRINKQISSGNVTITVPINEIEALKRGQEMEQIIM